MRVPRIRFEQSQTSFANSLPRIFTMRFRTTLRAAVEHSGLTRRGFLRTAATGTVGAYLDLCGSSRQGWAASDENNVSTPTFHSRHIPEPWLNFDTPTAQTVKRNGLCDTLEHDTLRRLKDHGVELIETRLTWWELEATRSRFDWSRVERAFDRIEQAGLKVGLMCWLQHPPAWYDPDQTVHARYRCLEHDQDSTILSLWDSATLEVYDRLLQAISERLGDRLSFVYANASGDYGEVCYPSGVKHYRFSPKHGHGGFWSGDRCARASYRAALEKRYGTIADLNTAWETRFGDFGDDLMPRLPLPANSLTCRRDYMTWYTESLQSFTDQVCRMYRNHFPDTSMSLPIGFPNERLQVGQIKSRAVKIAAKYGITVRWTGCGYLRSFPASNVLARRVASAAHFYGTNFGTEAALVLEKENAVNALYEGLANASSQIHDDPQNIFRASDVHRRLRPKLVVDPPDCQVVVYYPLESEMLETPGFAASRFVARCASLRAVADFDLCDSFMIRDGYLGGKTDLIIVARCSLPEDVVTAVLDYAGSRGRVWIDATCRVSSLEDDVDIVTRAQQRGYSVHDDSVPRAAGIYRLEKWPRFEPYASLAANDDAGPRCWTVHKKHVTAYSVERQDIDVRPRRPKQ